MPRLSIALLGAPRVELDGAAIEVDTRKAIALIAYLAVTQRSHSRDTLATLLWPEADQVGARAALRRTLSVLHKALGDEWLAIERESIGLKASDEQWSDVHQFRQWLAQCEAHGHDANDVCAACVAPLSAAVKLYRDDFLAGFTLRDSVNFDEWQFFQTETLRRELARALERLVQHHSTQSECEAAIAHARRWLALDPLHEPAHRHLMQLYAWSGQRAAALRQYSECVRILAKELEVSPLAETTQLYEAIKENKQILNPKPVPHSREARATQDKFQLSNSNPVWRGANGLQLATSSAPRPASNFQMVGRTSEWAALLRAYESIQDDGRLIVIEGEAGIGKTRLAEEFLQHARGRGAQCIAAHCYDGESNLAYAPFSEGLRALIALGPQDPWLREMPAYPLAEVAHLIPEITSIRENLPTVLPLDNASAQSRFFEGVRQFMWAACGGAMPGVVWLDDLQWADAASLDLLTYIVRRLRDHAWCILVSWRSADVPSDHRLRHLLGEAQRADTATVLTLSRLNLSAVSELAQSVTAFPSELSERLYQETEGLPFFIVEYLAAISQRERKGATTEWTLPGSVRALLQARLSAVGPMAAQLLNSAAVIGRSFDFDTLREVSGRGEEETVTALEELVAHGLISEAHATAEREGPIYDFSHEQLRALMYGETSQARRRLLHRRVADVLAAHSRQRTQGYRASQIAHHYRLAGVDAQAAEYYKLAGEHARHLYANAEALNHFQQALALGHPAAGALHEASGDLLTLRGEYRAALSSYETAAALSESQDRGSIEHKLGNVYLRQGDWELAEAHFQAALKTATMDRERARLYADSSFAAHQRGDLECASERAQQSLALAEAAGDQRALSEAHNILAIIARKRNDAAGAREHLQQSLRLAEMFDDTSARMTALNNLALVYGDRGDTAEAIRLTKTALQLCILLGDRHREAALHNNLADWFHACGQREAAMAHLKQAVAIFAEVGADSQEMQPEIWKLTEW